MDIYIAWVYEVSNRDVKIQSEAIPKSNNLVNPLLDGLIKGPVPDVGDQVLVIDLDSSHSVRFYLPIRKDFSNSSDKVLGYNDLELDGNLVVAGVDNLDWVAMNKKVITELQNLQTQITAIAQDLLTHQHTTAVGSTTGEIVPNTISYSAPNDVASTKLKTEG
jgi:hypothetical protein